MIRDHSIFVALHCVKTSPSARCMPVVKAATLSTEIINYNDIALKDLIKSNNI